MAHVLRVRGLANGAESPHDGRYVKRYNPNTPFGELALTSTEDMAAARKFETMDDVLAYRQAVSKAEPLRPDGQPNRPLSGLHLEVVLVRP